MIEIEIKLSDTHRIIVADGKLAIEAEGAPLYEEPLELAAPKLDMAQCAVGIAREQFAMEDLD